MADYNEQVNRLWDEWTAETEQESGDTSDFIEWAGSRLVLRPQDVKQLKRKQVTQALRQAKRYDEEGGFTYRAKQRSRCSMALSIISTPTLAERPRSGRSQRGNDAKRWRMTFTGRYVTSRG